MKNVSQAYSDSMTSDYRNQSFAKVVITNADPEAAKDGEWESDFQDSWSETETLDYPYNYPKNANVSLELNRWLLNGNQVFNVGAPEGFVSDIMSGEDGTFDVEPYMFRIFSKPYTLIGISLVFDSRLNEWPLEIEVIYYRDNDKVMRKTVNPTDFDCPIYMPCEDVDRVDVVFKKMLPYRRPRVEYALFGLRQVFDDSKLSGTTQTHDVDPLTRRLPDEQFTFSVIDYDRTYDPENTSGEYAFLNERSAVSIQHSYTLDDGSIEQLKPDLYQLDGKPTTENHIVTFHATGLLGSMTGTYYKSSLGERDFYSIAEDILLDANLAPRPDGGNPWVIDDSLKTMKTTAPMPIDTHANCLQRIAHAARCKIYTDDDNVVYIKPFNPSDIAKNTDFNLDFNSISENSQSISKIDMLKEVNVSKHVYTVDDGDASELFRGKTSDTDFHVEFDAPAQDIQISVSGGTMVSSIIYAQAVDMVLSDGVKTVTITGKKISDNLSTLTVKVNADGETDSEENELITSDEMALSLAHHVIAYLAYRNTYELQYRGNPELECGDVIGLQTNYSDILDAMILKDEITYNGALHGSMILKGLN